MKRIMPTLIFLAALAIIAVGLLKPWVGDVTETWQTENQTFKLRVDQRAERCLFLCGAYYIFQSAPKGSDDWKEIMTFRHDDPNPIPIENVRFVNEQIGYVFMGWTYAVTTDGGATWRVWNAQEDFQNWRCCNYGLIKDVNIEPDGKGFMTISVISAERGEVPMLRTEDYGRHWRLP